MSKHRLKIQLNHRPIVYVFRKKESLQKKKEKVFKEKILQKKKTYKNNTIGCKHGKFNAFTNTTVNHVELILVAESEYNDESR